MSHKLWLINDTYVRKFVFQILNISNISGLLFQILCRSCFKCSKNSNFYFRFLTSGFTSNYLPNFWVLLLVQLILTQPFRLFLQLFQDQFQPDLALMGFQIIFGLVALSRLKSDCLSANQSSWKYFQTSLMSNFSIRCIRLFSNILNINWFLSNVTPPIPLASWSWYSISLSLLSSFSARASFTFRDRDASSASFSAWLYTVSTQLSTH